MKIIIGKDELLEGLQRVFSVVPQKPTLPVLSNFLLRVDAGNLFISGTDMDMSITTSLKCTVEGEEAVTVNAKHFLSIIRELPEGDVTIIIEDERVTIEFENGKSSVMGMSFSDFPAVRDTIDGISVVFSGSDLTEMLDKAGFAVALDRSRIALTGVYWKVSSTDMIMVSTDGHRLSLFKKGMDIETDKVLEVVVPLKTLNHASRIFSGGIELNSVVFTESMIMFDFGTTKILSKLIEEPYPDFRQVIPTENSKKVFVSTDDLSSAVRRVSVLSNTITHQVRFSVSPGQIEIDTTNPDIGGEAKETIVIRYDGDPLVISFNAFFILEILRKMDTDEVLMELELSDIACIMKPVEQEKNEENIYLIMPLRLNE